MVQMNHAHFLEINPLFKLEMHELVAAAFVLGFPRGGDGEGRAAYGSRWDAEAAPKNMKVIRDALGKLGLSKAGNKKVLWGRLSDFVLKHPLPRAESIAKIFYTAVKPEKIVQIPDIIRLYLYERKPGRPPFLSMANMYQAMLKAYGRNPLELYAKTMGALDSAAQLTNLHEERAALRVADREAQERARREAEEARKREAERAHELAELSAQQREAAAETERLAAIQRAEEQERARVARAAREARLREPGPLIREDEQRRCLQHAMVRGLRRAAEVAHGGSGGEFSSETIDAGAVRAVEAAVDTWARGVLRRLVRDAAFLKRSYERKPLTGMVVGGTTADRMKGHMIRGMQILSEKRAREDLTSKIEARAEGTDLHDEWQKKRKRHKHQPATFSAEKEGTLDKVAEELLTATVCRHEVRQRYAGQDGLEAMGVTGVRGSATEDGGKFLVTTEALKRLVSSRRRVEAEPGTGLHQQSSSSSSTSLPEEKRLKVQFPPAVQEAVLNGSILEAARRR